MEQIVKKAKVNSDIPIADRLASAKGRFDHIGTDPLASEGITRPTVGYWKDAWIRLRRNRIAMISLLVILVYVLMAIFGSMMVPFDYKTNSLSENNLAPNKVHWFGTDTLGRDLWARVWQGARVSLMIGLVSAVMQLTLGVIVGGLAGYFGGTFDLIVMRITEILDAIPFLVMVILIMMVLGSGIVPLILAFAITGWISMARLVRGQVYQLKNQEFMMAAKAMGSGTWWLIVKHLVPNMMGVLIVTLTMKIPQAIFSEAFLSYIGLGVKPPETSWGQLANLGSQVMSVYPYQLLIPAFFISTMMLAMQLFGDGLRDALDPKLRK